MIRKITFSLLTIVSFITAQWSKIPGIPGGEIQGIFRSDDSVFISDINNVIYAHKEGESTFTRYGRWPYDGSICQYIGTGKVWIAEDRNGSFYKSKDNGLTWKSIKIDYPDGYSYDGAGRFYITLDGVYCFDAARDTVYEIFPYDSRDDLKMDSLEKSHKIKDLIGSSNGNVFLSAEITLEDNTKCQSVVRVSDDGKKVELITPLVKSFPEADCVTKLGSETYMSTDSGIYKFSDNSWMKTGGGKCSDNSPGKLMGRNGIIYTVLFTPAPVFTGGGSWKDRLFVTKNDGVSWQEVNLGFRYLSNAFYLDSTLIISTDGGTFSLTDNQQLSVWDCGLKNRRISKMAVCDSGIAGLTEGATSIHFYRWNRNWELYKPVDTINGTRFFDITAYKNRIFLASSGGANWPVVVSDDMGNSWKQIGTCETMNFIKALPSGLFVSSTASFKFLKWGTDKWCTSACIFTDRTSNFPSVYTIDQSGSRFFIDYDDSVFTSDTGILKWNSFGGTIPKNISTLFSGNSFLYAFKEDTLFRTPLNEASWIRLPLRSVERGITGVTAFRDTLFAFSCSTGVFISADNGDSWTHMNNDLYHNKITSYASSPNCLAVVTDAGDYYVYGKSITTSVKIKESMIKLVPSVVTSGRNLKIKLNNPQRIKGFIISLDGTIVQKFDSEKTVLESIIKTHNFKSGIYLLNFNYGKSIFSNSFTIIR